MSPELSQRGSYLQHVRGGMSCYFVTPQTLLQLRSLQGDDYSVELPGAKVMLTPYKGTVASLMNAGDQGEHSNCRFVVSSPGTRRRGDPFAIRIEATRSISIADPLLAAYGATMTKQIRKQSSGVRPSRTTLPANILRLYAQLGDHARQMLARGCFIPPEGSNAESARGQITTLTVFFSIMQTPRVLQTSFSAHGVHSRERASASATSP